MSLVLNVLLHFLLVDCLSIGKFDNSRGEKCGVYEEDLPSFCKKPESAFTVFSTNSGLIS